jgi:integrase
VFTAAEGGPVRHHNFYVRHYKPAVRRADLPPALRFHDLRHSAAAILIAEGCSERQLQAILGDTSRAVDRYVHLFEGHEDALMERVETTMARTLMLSLMLSSPGTRTTLEFRYLADRSNPRGAGFCFADDR